MDDLRETVKHLVVLMLENRSFDHMLGYLRSDDGFDGLQAAPSNKDTSGNDVAAHRIAVDDPNAYWYPLCKPGEGFTATNEQLFGTALAPAEIPAMPSGFVTQFEAELAAPMEPPLEGATATSIMGMYSPELLPILSALARNYAVCDRWFASAPTMTMPNRAFALAGTCLGRLKDSGYTPMAFQTPSIFGRLSDIGASWKIYGYNSQPLTQADFPDLLTASKGHFGRFSDFQTDVGGDDFPTFCFLEPAWADSEDPLNAMQENDQHPLSSIALGERFIKEVYKTVRGGPHWHETLLLVIYDEHGGCYDHVMPPTRATKPDNHVGDVDNFDFSRFGVRVPAVLVSPRIEKGTIYRAPEEGPPLDHTSILASIERWLTGIEPLGRRDAVAPDFWSVLTLQQPRDDDALVDQPAPVYAAPVADGQTRLRQQKPALPKCSRHMLMP
jgi:phospholipase C